MYGDYCMPLMCAQYRGYSIQAGAFELVGTGRFIASLLVCKVGCTDRNLIDLPTDLVPDLSVPEAVDASVSAFEEY